MPLTKQFATLDSHERHGTSNHRHLDCLLNSLLKAFRIMHLFQLNAYLTLISQCIYRFKVHANRPKGGTCQSRSKTIPNASNEVVAAVENLVRTDPPGLPSARPKWGPPFRQEKKLSFIYYFLPRFTVSCMKLVIFYSIITFSYTTYFVHSYTVDVVFTLSYWGWCTWRRCHTGWWWW